MTAESAWTTGIEEEILGSISPDSFKRLNFGNVPSARCRLSSAGTPKPACRS